MAQDVLFIAPSFLEGGIISNGTSHNTGGLSRLQILHLQDRASRGELTNISRQACFDTFSPSFQIEFDAVLLIIKSQYNSGSSLIQTAEPGHALAGYKDNLDGMELGIRASSVEYCLASPITTNVCEVSLNSPVLVFLALLNLISLAVMALSLALSWRSFYPLVTLGDAISSFLEDFDLKLRGNSLLNKQEVSIGRWFNEAKYWVPKKTFWFQAPSIPIWFVTSLIWLTTTGLAAAGLGINIVTSPDHSSSAFGQAHAQSALVFPTGSNRIGAALLAGLPHLLLAGLYLSANSLLTMYFLSHEFSLFAISYRTLRVSSHPQGPQKASLFLTLPRPYSWVLLFLFAAMGFVLSQSVFVININYVASSSAQFAQNSLVTSAETTATAENISGETPQALLAIGISGIGLSIFLGLLVTLLVLILGLGFRCPQAPDPENENSNPLVLIGGTCSAVIASRCRRSPYELDIPLQPTGIKWGVIGNTEGFSVGHCGFSFRRVGMLKAGSSYA